MRIMTQSTLVSSLLAIVVGTAVIVAIPNFFDEYEVLQATIYVILAILALSLAFIWGFGGILSFGHAVFFGLGSYSYAIAAINIGNTSLAFMVSIAVPALFAAILGYFMFYGRISEVYLGAITLTVTLIFFKVMNSTSGPEYRIGKAPLGGFNGIPSVPTLTVPGFPDWQLGTIELFSFAVALLTALYVILRFLIASDFGRVVIAVRENERRAELLGYDVRLYKLITFMIGGAIAGISGCLYANWGSYTDPSVFALSQSVQAIIWVVVGGVGTLLGPILGCLLIQAFISYLTTVDVLNTNIILGGVLTLMVLLLPQGLVPSIRLMMARFATRSESSVEVAQ